MRAEDSGDCAVLGAGLMGHGIAQVLAQRPGRVWLYDIAQPVLERALARIEASLGQLADYGLIDEEWPAVVLGRIQPTTDLAPALEKAWLVAEAAPEDLALKRRLMAQVEKWAPPEAIVAINSSGLTLAQIGEGMQQRQRVVGSHFFLPAQLVPLVEVSRGAETSAEVVERVLAHWRACGKDPIRIEGDIPGYIANRMQGALVREATSLLGQGLASAEDIDKAVRLGFGLRYLVSGPLEQRDLGGLELHVALAGQMWPHLNTSPGPHPFVVDQVQRGETGLDAGRGFIDWQDRDPEKVRQQRSQELVDCLVRLGLWSGPDTR
ncbi:MAG: 3-hydroxyacyl-CoA dehydrogenase family protein [Candidatus Latescibacteria bacterium]|nr:3-hydroxyacyl-CoA dehydrogenase family protein [Candidatus Latescibacterota bacterium]